MARKSEDGQREPLAASQSKSFGDDLLFRRHAVVPGRCLG